MAPTATRRIAILPDAVANQIAAGEVVERPASVVKELVENAIDAGARHVRVELEQGGKTLISVSDDGSGMSRDDAVLALDRHATSKIVSAADLVGVRTFGFRGEALPAIASVSRFTLLTSDGGEATEISVTGGRLDGVTPAVRQRGTTVTVRALFFNTPARRKFLRSVPSETRAASEAMATLALAHPAVGFELVVDGDTRLQVPPGQDEPARLAGVWGPHLAGTLVPVALCLGPAPGRGICPAPRRRRAHRAPHPALRQRPALPRSVPGARRRSGIPLGDPSRRSTQPPAPARGGSRRSGRERASRQARGPLPRPHRGGAGGRRSHSPCAGRARGRGAGGRVAADAAQRDE